MAISIRNPQTEKLAREVASISGENITVAITRALEERLERLQGRRITTDLAKEIIKISKRCSLLPDIDKKSPENILGYNEDSIF